MHIGEVSFATLSRWIEEQGCIGRVKRKWGWWHNPDGTKGLGPIHGTRYLYRGQNRRYWSCPPTISRNVYTRAHSLNDLESIEQYKILDSLVRSDWYCEIIKSHPAFRWANNENFSIDRMSLAQHYELPTGYIDLTESIEVALFFACCTFTEGEWTPKSKGKGILYRLDWVESPDNIRSRIKAIGFQPFARPYAQWAWTAEMILGEDFEDIPGVEAVLFDHNEALGERLLDMFNGGEVLMCGDPVFDWASNIKHSNELPRSNGLAIVDDISNDPMALLPNDPELVLREIEKANDVSFVDNPSFRISRSEIEILQKEWDSKEEEFLDSLINDTQVQLVRTRKTNNENQA